MPARALVPGDADNGRRLTYSLFMRGFFSLMMAIGFVLILFSYLYSPRNPSVPDLIPYSILIGLSLVFSTFILKLFFSYFIVNDQGIERKAFWARRKFIPWSEVDSIIYVWGRRRSEYQVRGAGKMFALSTGLVGLSSFGRMVVAKVPPDRWTKSKREILNMVEREENN
mgnify:CR=1 FL=1